METTENISKNQKRKLERQRRLLENRKERRKREKAKAKERRKSINPDRDGVSKKQRKLLEKQRLTEALKSGPRIVVDCQFESHMNDKELTHFASQLRRIYGANKVLEKPAHLYWSSLDENSKSFKICCEKNDGFQNYIVDHSPKAVNELFLNDECIYLTPDSPNVLELLDESKVYIIGGLIDDSVKKNTTVQFANKHNIQTARLPILEHCEKTGEGTFKQILTINQVFDIIVTYFACKDWKQALSVGLPNRIDSGVMAEAAVPTKPKWFTPTKFPQWYQNLSSAFRQYFQKQYITDVIFHCPDGEIGAHRMILELASPLLKQTFQLTSTDNDTWHISLPDVSVEVLKHFIEAIYLGSIPCDEEMFEEVLHLVMVFDLPVPDLYNKEAGSMRGVLKTEGRRVRIVKQREDEDEPMPDQQHLNTDDYNIANEGQVQVVQTDTGEFLFVMCDNEVKADNAVNNVPQPATTKTSDEDVEASEIRKMKLKEIKENQNRYCPICCRRAIEHRINNENPAGLGEPKFTYECCIDECTNRVLKNARMFNSHMTKQHDPTSLEAQFRVCPLCFQPRLDHKNRDPAILATKGKKKGSYYKCCQCAAAKLTAKKFFAHAENHIAKKYHCQFCSRGFSYEHLLNNHIYKEHGAGQNEKLVCNVPNCGYETKYKQTMYTHMREKHQGIKRTHRQTDAWQMVQCPKCKKELKKWYFQQFHRKTCASGNLVYQCDICKQDGFVNATTLKNHVRAKHSAERPYACEHCDARYATAMSLSGHRTRKHGVNKAGDAVPKKLFPCAQCGKMLTSRNKLAQHIKVIHEGEKDYKCDHCDKRFTSKSNKQIHEGTMHTGILPYKCEYCDKMFGRKSALAQHRSQVHAHTEGTEFLTSTEALVQAIDPGPYYVIDGPAGPHDVIEVNDCIPVLTANHHHVHHQQHINVHHGVHQ